MVALQFLVLSVPVRIGVEQRRTDSNKDFFIALRPHELEAFFRISYSLNRKKGQFYRNMFYFL